MVHTYTLIHDDLPAMDDDDYRRGKLSCHKKFGEDIAILAGNTLYTIATQTIAAKLPQFYPPKKVLTVITTMMEYLGPQGVAGGQAMDLKSSSESDLAYLRHSHNLKTGYTIRLCVMLPAILENANNATIKMLDRYAENLGLLFQITDDILDANGSLETLGKTPGKDQINNKASYVTLLGLNKSHQEAEGKALQAKKDISKLDNSYLLVEVVDYILNRL